MTFDKVAELIAEQLGKNKADIKPETEIIKDLGADSLDIVQMLMGVEDEYGITIPEEEAVNIRTIADIVKVIDSKK